MSFSGRKRKKGGRETWRMWALTVVEDLVVPHGQEQGHDELLSSMGDLSAKIKLSVRWSVWCAAYSNRLRQRLRLLVDGTCTIL